MSRLSAPWHNDQSRSPADSMKNAPNKLSILFPQSSPQLNVGDPSKRMVQLVRKKLVALHLELAASCSTIDVLTDVNSTCNFTLMIYFHLDRKESLIHSGMQDFTLQAPKPRKDQHIVERDKSRIQWAIYLTPTFTNEINVTEYDSTKVILI